MALVYHNITPPEYFIGVHKDLVKLCFRGRRELTAYIDRCDLALGDSEYNREELEALGFHAHRRAAGRARLHAPRRPARRRLAAAFDDGWTNVMFVGRVIPNKKFENVIRAFHAYRTRHNPRSRLLLVGSHSGFERYLAMLQALIARLGTPDVHFLGHVTERGADRALRRRRPVPLRQRARGLLRPDHRGLLQAGPGARPRRHGCARDDGRRRRALRHHDPFEIARLMEAVLDDHAARGGGRRVPGRRAGAAAGEGLRRHLLRNVAALLAAGPRQAPEVAWDFWAQFEQFERLEELRQFRPALFRALPPPPGTRPGTRRPALGGSGPDPAYWTTVQPSILRHQMVPQRPDPGFPSPDPGFLIINQWVPAAHKGDAIGDSARVVRDMLRRRGHQSDLFALTIDDDLREDVRPFADASAGPGTSRSFTSRSRRR